jgi:hypothetical protein
LYCQCGRHNALDERTITPLAAAAKKGAATAKKRNTATDAQSE